MVTFLIKHWVAVSLTVLVVVASPVTRTGKAEQSTSTTPSTGSATPSPVIPTAVVNTVVQAQPAAAPAPASVGDPYGFMQWLNSTRASYGLSPVGYDPNLESWAAMNNGQQQSRGMGHYVMGPARRQNSAMGQYASIGAMWMASPAHRAALLDPTIRFIGIAGLGAYWTFNAN